MDFSNGVIHTVPIYKRHALYHVILCVYMAGWDLRGCLRRSSWSFTTMEKQEIVQGIKEKLCCFALDLEQDVAPLVHP